MSGGPSDVEPFYIPSHLDDPERWMFWTWDEAAALLVPFAVLGLGYGAFLTGIGTSLALWYGLRKLKGAGQGSVVAAAAYWLFPAGVMRLKGTPDSAIREYVG